MTLGIIPIICISTGVLVYIIMLIVDRYPPKKINNLYGYRTKRSMQSQKHWDYAQTYSSMQMKKACLAMIFLGIVGSFIDLKEGWEIGIAIAIVTVFTFAPFFATEAALKEEFPD